MSEKKEMDVVRKQNEPSEAAKKAAMEISNVFCAKQGELKTVQEIIQSAIDAAARVEPAEKELIEARSWALDILDLTDAHLKKIDPDYEKLDWRTDSFCKSHARKLLEGATSTPQVQASEQTSLLPCPFCGDSRASTVWESCEPISEGDTNRLWFIECERCGAQGPVQNRENECVNPWNTRANASLGAAQQVSGKADNTDAVHSKPHAETGLAFRTLRQANIDRDKNEGGWHEIGSWNLNDWGVAVAGEVGEMLNVIKKIRRGDFTLDQVRADVADELADILTYLDLLAHCAGIDIESALVKKFNEVSARIGSKVLLVSSPSQAPTDTTKEQDDQSNFEWLRGCYERIKASHDNMRAALKWYAGATYPDDGSGRPPEAFQRRAVEALARSESIIRSDELKSTATVREQESSGVAEETKTDEDKWSYGSFRATLYRNGLPFAMVTPDGRSALDETRIQILLAALRQEPTAKEATTKKDGT